MCVGGDAVTRVLIHSRKINLCAVLGALVSVR